MLAKGGRKGLLRKEEETHKGQGYFIISKHGKPKEVSMFSWCKQKADLHRWNKWKPQRLTFINI